MSDPYLLAASLLTTGSISVPPPPVLPPILPDSLCALLASTAAQTLQSITTHKFVPVIETTSPEFSQTQLISAESPEFIAPVLTPTLAQGLTQQATNLQALPTSQSTAPMLISGSHLYLLRVAALRAGKLYTRLPANSFQSVWAKGAFPEALLQQQPTHEQWIHLLALEAQAVAKGQGDNRLAILVGDSLSMWFPSERLPGIQLWLNQGISGENTGQVLKRLSAFSQTRPETIYVMVGINDLRQGASDRVILDNLRQIMRRLRLNHPQAKVIVQSILPTRVTTIPNERIRDLNQQIAVMALQEGTSYLNLQTWFTDEQNQLRQDLTTDGIHLTRRGYEVWQEALKYAEAVLATNRAN